MSCLLNSISSSAHLDLILLIWSVSIDWFGTDAMYEACSVCKKLHAITLPKETWSDCERGAQNVSWIWWWTAQFSQASSTNSKAFYPPSPRYVYSPIPASPFSSLAQVPIRNYHVVSVEYACTWQGHISEHGEASFCSGARTRFAAFVRYLLLHQCSKTTCDDPSTDSSFFMLLYHSAWHLLYLARH